MRELHFSSPAPVSTFWSVGPSNMLNVNANVELNVDLNITVVDNCDPDKWSKVEIEGICRDFGYTYINKLWYTMPGMAQERANFHLVDDDEAMYMIELVKDHEEIHVYVEHPIDKPIQVDKGKDVSEGV